MASRTSASFRRARRVLSFLILLAPTLNVFPAWAEPIPAPVEKMILEAAKTGSPRTLDTVAAVAAAAVPESAMEIRALVDSLRTRAEAERIAQLEQLNYFQGWHGEGELGASKVTGNTDTTDIAIGVHLTKDGLKWAHKFNVTADYQRAQGVSGVDKYLAGYEANYKFNERLFTFGLLQYDRDHFAGFNNRLTESFGLGYSLFHTPTLMWDVTAGPAFRQIDQVLGPSQYDVEARLATHLTWNITDATVLTEDVSFYVGGGNSTSQSTTAVTTKLIDALAARASFNIKKETAPGPGFKRTDTASRVTLVYGF